MENQSENKEERLKTLLANGVKSKFHPETEFTKDVSEGQSEGQVAGQRGCAENKRKKAKFYDNQHLQHFVKILLIKINNIENVIWEIFQASVRNSSISALQNHRKHVQYFCFRVDFPFRMS